MVLGKKVAIFEWEWGRNSAPRDGQKSPEVHHGTQLLLIIMQLYINYNHATTKLAKRVVHEIKFGGIAVMKI